MFEIHDESGLRPQGSATIAPVARRRARVLRSLVPRALLIGSLVLGLGFLAFPLAAATPKVVGDANGDGRFAHDDLLLVEHSLSTGNVVTGPDGLSDVAEPCDHRLDGADLALLTQALEGTQWRLSAYSHCHGQDVGSELPEAAPSTPVTLDDLFWLIADQVPEFGGLYFDDNGEATVVLTDLGALSDAEEAVFEVFGPDRLDTETLNAVEGRYGFAELHEYRILARDVLIVPGVNSLDTDEVLNRVWIGLESPEARAAAEAKLDELGVPLEVVVFDLEGHYENSNPPDYTAFLRPMKAGIQIGRAVPDPTMMATCTLGPIVERFGVRGYLTNSHCTPNIGSVDGTMFFQPSIVDPSFAAGSEVLDPPLLSQAQNPACPSGEMCRWSDSVFVQTTVASTTRRGRILTDTPAWHTRKITGKEYFPLHGDHVSKSGRKTGQTAGKITQTCVDLGPSGDVTNTWLCQYKADFVSDGGDSGSPVYKTTYPDTAILYGLYWGRWVTPLVTRGVFGGVSNLEADLGFLHVDAVEGSPIVSFITPQNGENLGPGGFFNVTLSASVTDHEDGPACPGCSVTWSSSLDGPLGTDAVSNGVATRQVVLSGAGPRILKAVATDSAGATAETWVVVKTSSSAPSVWIQSPSSGAVFTVGVGQPVAAGSFDPDTWLPLPCNSLIWSTDLAADGTSQGCNPVLQFATPGPRVLTVTGTDGGGLSDSDSISINVTGSPTSGPPQVTILAPGYGNMYPRTATLNLVGKAIDPDGQSPIQYQWILTGPYLYGGSPVVIGTASGANDQQISLSWTPSANVAPTCGGVGLTLELRATDADNEQGSASQPLYISDPPC